MNDDNSFTAVKVFSATLQPGREALGDQITSWLAAHRSARVVDVIVRQSSDDGFHCLSIILFFVHTTGASAAHGIAGAPLTSHGYNDKQPLVKNDSEEHRAENRRVELKKPDCNE